MNSQVISCGTASSHKVQGWVNEYSWVGVRGSWVEIWWLAYDLVTSVWSKPSSYSWNCSVTPCALWMGHWCGYERNVSSLVYATHALAHLFRIWWRMTHLSVSLLLFFSSNLCRPVPCLYISSVLLTYTRITVINCELPTIRFCDWSLPSVL